MVVQIGAHEHAGSFKTFAHHTEKTSTNQPTHCSRLNPNGPDAESCDLKLDAASERKGRTISVQFSPANHRVIPATEAELASHRGRQAGSNARLCRYLRDCKFRASGEAMFINFFTAFGTAFARTDAVIR